MSKDTSTLKTRGINCCNLISSQCIQSKHLQQGEMKHPANNASLIEGKLCVFIAVLIHIVRPRSRLPQATYVNYVCDIWDIYLKKTTTNNHIN